MIIVGKDTISSQMNILEIKNRKEIPKEDFIISQEIEDCVILEEESIDNRVDDSLIKSRFKVYKELVIPDVIELENISIYLDRLEGKTIVFNINHPFLLAKLVYISAQEGSTTRVLLHHKNSLVDIREG